MPNPLAVIEEELSELGSEETRLLADAANGNLDPFRSRLDEIHDRTVVLEEDRDRVRRIQARERSAPAAGVEGGEPGPITELGPMRRAPRSLGRQFAESAEWLAFVKAVA